MRFRYANAGHSAVYLMQDGQPDMAVPGDDPRLEGATIEPWPEDEAWAALRAERARRLAASDWTQMADLPKATRDAWKPYRQALRDLPDTTADPRAPAWPVSPDEQRAAPGEES